MKRFFISLILLLYAIGAQGQGIKFDNQTHNFGTIEESGGTVSHTFSYTNTASEPVVIINVETTCGCTTPHFSRQPLPVGATNELTIEFDPMNRPGRIDKHIYIVTNVGRFTLSVDGIVNARPRSLAERYPFILDGGTRLDGLGYFSLQVPVGKEITAEVGIANGNPAVPTTIGIDNEQLPTSVSASVGNDLIAAGEEDKIRVAIRGVNYGAFSYRIPLMINGRKTAESITMSGSVVDDFSKLSDEQLLEAPRAKFSTFYHRLGNVRQGEQHEAVIEVTNIGKSTLIVRAIEGSAQIKASISSRAIKVGASAKLTVNYSAPQSGYDSGWVRLIVNDPRNPVPEIRFVATVE